jgi:hypothetical protein
MNVTSMHPITPIAPQFLAEGGEMGKRTREYDWSNTSVGSVDTWPQSLRSILSVVLRSKFPMFLWWGDDLVQFYNDAYRPSLGNDGKHPTALGQKGEDPAAVGVLHHQPPSWCRAQKFAPKKS